MNTHLARTVVGGILACLLALSFTVLPVAAAPQAVAPDFASHENDCGIVLKNHPCLLQEAFSESN